MRREPTCTKDVIIQSMARTLYVCAYADAIEEGSIEGPRPGPGEDWFDFAPTLHDSESDAEELAEKMLAQFLRMNAPHLEPAAALDELFAEWCTPESQTYATRPHDADHFGHAIAMQSLGQGVGLNDDTGQGCRRWETGYFCGLNL